MLFSYRKEFVNVVTKMAMRCIDIPYSKREFDGVHRIPIEKRGFSYLISIGLTQ